MTGENTGLAGPDMPAAAPAPMKGQLARRNLATAVLQRGAGVVSGFVRIPLLLHTLGPAHYGLWLGIFAATRYSSLGGLAAALAMPPAAAWAGRFDLALLFLGFSLLVFWKHRENVARLIAGSEPRVGGLA